MYKIYFKKDGVTNDEQVKLNFKSVFSTWGILIKNMDYLYPDRVVIKKCITEFLESVSINKTQQKK
jgi:hypothetical protein